MAISYGIELDFHHTLKTYTDKTETKEQEMEFLISVSGSFDKENTDYYFDIHLNKNTDGINLIVAFLNPDLYQEIEKEVEHRVAQYIEEALEEWRVYL